MSTFVEGRRPEDAEGKGRTAEGFAGCHRANLGRSG